MCFCHQVNKLYSGKGLYQGRVVQNSKNVMIKQGTSYKPYLKPVSKQNVIRKKK